MPSYRILARLGASLVLLAAIAAVGLGLSHVPLPRPRRTPAHAAAWNRWKQVEVAKAAPGGRPPIRVLVVGASVSHGLGASTPGHDYVSDLRRLIEARTGRPVTVTVFSRPGARVAFSAKWQLPPGQQIVITQLITNDFIEGTPLLSYAENVSRLLTRIRKTSPSAKLLCLGAWEPAVAVDRIGVPVAAYDGLDQRACAAHHGSYLSPSSIFQVAAYRGPTGRHTAFGRGDDFHPNNLGHEHLAAAILQRLTAEHALPAPPQDRKRTVLARARHDARSPAAP